MIIRSTNKFHKGKKEDHKETKIKQRVGKIQLLLSGNNAV
jgi:hypothetical protein